MPDTKKTVQPVQAPQEVAGFVPVKRHYKVLGAMVAIMLLTNTATGFMTFWMGETSGKAECAAEGSKIAAEIQTHDYKIIQQESDALINSDSIDDYILHH